MQEHLEKEVDQSTERDIKPEGQDEKLEATPSEIGSENQEETKTIPEQEIHTSASQSYYAGTDMGNPSNSLNDNETLTGVYQPPVSDNAESDKAATISMILGIVGLVTTFMCCCVSFIPAIISLIYSAKSKKLSVTGALDSKALVGKICSIIAIVMFVLYVLFFILYTIIVVAMGIGMEAAAAIYPSFAL